MSGPDFISSECFGDEGSQEQFSMILSNRNFTAGEALCTELVNGLPASVLNQDELDLINDLIRSIVAQPTAAPTESPTLSPTNSPTLPTFAPTRSPTPLPTPEIVNPAPPVWASTVNKVAENLEDIEREYESRNPLDGAFRVYIGLRDLDPQVEETRDTDRFTWVDNNEFNFATTAGVEPWASAEPNNFRNNIEDCVEIRLENLLWNDLPCRFNGLMMCRSACLTDDDDLIGTTGNEGGGGAGNNALWAAIALPMLLSLLLGVATYRKLRQPTTHDTLLKELDLNIQTPQPDMGRANVPSGLKLSQTRIRGWSLRWWSSSTGSAEVNRMTLSGSTKDLKRSKTEGKQAVSL